MSVAGRGVGVDEGFSIKSARRSTSFVSAVAQQPMKDDRGVGANLCRKRRSAAKLPATAKSSGTGDGGLVLRNRRTGDGEGWEKNGETVRRSGGLGGFRSLKEPS